MNIDCPYCGNVVYLEEGHDCWICPRCRAFIIMEELGNKKKEG